MTFPRFLLVSGALAALLPSAPLSASARTVAMRQAADRDGAIADYVRARAADDLGELNVAAAGYAAALANNPGDTMLALRTFRLAIAAGDMALATRTAKTLDSGGSLPPDGAVVLLGDAVSRKDWAGASALVDRVEREKLFAFLAPAARAWIAQGTRKGDPLALPPQDGLTGFAAAYAAEHRALLLIATGKTAAGIAAIGALDAPAAGRADRLKIAAAAGLAAQRKRDAAIALLAGDGSAIARARATLVAGRKLRGAIDTPATGIAELLVRVATDLNGEQAGPLALEFARLATILAPDDSEAWLVTASLLSATGADQAALDALGHVAADDPFIGAARDARLTLLGRTGHADQALAEARAATTAKDAGAGEWARLADLLTDANRFTEAADAYGKALALAGGDKASPDVAWPLLLQQGNALLQSGDWPGARKVVQQALAIAPQQPAILNFLGYSQIERGENVAAAAAMIAQASALAPDDAAITDSLGWSWYVRGDLGKAIPLLEQAARRAPSESDINEHLGDAYWKAGRMLDARYAWRAALVAADPDQAKRIRAKVDYGATGKP
jgi:tetratricopeptide (TPR) repeat protein